MEILLVILGILVFVGLIVILKTRRKKEIEEMVGMNGFVYDPEQDIFYSEMDAWQRKYGYCQLYDELSAPIGLIFECEPIKFEYEGKRWLIEIWKGQYGVTTGCELGVYTTKAPDLNIPRVFDGTFYGDTADEDHLDMTISLIKDEAMLLYRTGRHWWLTGFILGAFSEPEELKMQVKIVLKSIEMRDVFIDALVNLEYARNEIIRDKEAVYFIFDRPHSAQPLAMGTAIRNTSQERNKMFCDWFYDLTKDIENTQEKIQFVKKKSPALYNELPNVETHKKIFGYYEKIIENIGK